MYTRMLRVKCIGLTGTSVFGVTAHEAGHSLGIDHSRDQDSIMMPYFNPNTYSIDSFTMPQDDINGKQLVYTCHPELTGS